MNNEVILRTKNAEFSEYYFYLNTNIYGDFQTCISVPLNKINQETVIGSKVNKRYPAEKIDHKDMIDHPKYFNENQG